MCARRRVQAENWRSMAEPKKKVNRVYLTWSHGMDTALLDTLVEHHNQGDHAQNGWKAHVYNACIKNVKEKCDVVNKDKITARIKTFDKHYEIITKMLSQSGFGWDSEKNMVMVDSEEVWARYVEANKEAGCYRNKEVKNWEAIQTIYSKDHANGAGAKTAAEFAQERVTAATRVADETPDEVAPKRQRVGEAILSMIGEMRTSFDDALKTTEPLPMPKVTPPNEVLEAIQNVEAGLGDADTITCYTKLTANERSFESFMALPEALKKHYLLALLK